MPYLIRHPERIDLFWIPACAGMTEYYMKISLDKEKCIGCGTCESICGEIFVLGDDSKAHLKSVEAKEAVVEEKEVAQSPCAEEAADSCAVQAIEIKK